MPFNFPDSPTLNQVYAYNGQAWKWNGEAWDKNKGETVSVKDFGAAGDGVADESTAIQNAITAVAVSGGCVFFPAGTYIVNAQITAASNVCLCGESRESTTLRLKNSTNQNMLFAGSATTGFAVCDLTLDGNKANNTAGAAIDLTAATRFVMRYCRVINTAGNGIVLQSSGVDAQIISNHFSGCGSSAGHSISLSAQTRAVVVGNIIRDSVDSGVNLGACISCVISNNTIVNGTRTTNGFAGVRASSNSGLYNVISGNYIEKFTRGVFILGTSYTNISNNILNDLDAQGILIQSDASNTNTLGFNVVKGNTVRLPGAGASAGSRDGIRVDGVDYNLIEGNQLLDFNLRMEYGVNITQNATGNGLYNRAENNLIRGYVTGVTNATFRDRNVLGPNMGDPFNASIASAATITLPEFGDYFNITGTTGISTINGGWLGRIVSLQFSGALTVTDGGGGGNMNLAGNYSTAAGSVLTLRHTGSQWAEVARSNN